MTRQEKIMDTAEKFQENCHTIASEVLSKKPNITVQDATNVWMFHKLAELQQEINELSEKIDKIGFLNRPL